MQRSNTPLNRHSFSFLTEKRVNRKWLQQRHRVQACVSIIQINGLSVLLGEVAPSSASSRTAGSCRRGRRLVGLEANPGILVSHESNGITSSGGDSKLYLH